MIKKIRDILQSGICLSDFTDKCKNDGACRKCEDEALEKLIAEHDAKVRAEVIEFISDKLIYPLLNEYDIQLWKDIEYIELADKWVEFVDKYKSDDETIINELTKWILKELKEQNR